MLLLLAGCYGRVGLDPNRRGDDDDDAASDDDDVSSDDDDASGDDDDAAGDDDDAAGDDDDAAGDDDDATADDDDVADKFQIDDLDPDHGSTDGGFVVNIEYTGDAGTDDADDVDVHFGDAQAEVLAVTSDEIVVTAPPGCEYGEVELTVETPNGDDEADFEFDPAGEDLDGAIFGVYRNLVPADTSLNGGAVELGWFEPEDDPPLTHLPPLGTCSSNIVPPANNRTYYEVGPSVTITAGTPIVATLDPATDTYTANASVDAVPNNASYTIYSVTDPDGCSIPAEAVVSAPPAINLVQPDITSTKFADCWSMETGYGPVEWTGPYDSGDYVFVTLTNAENTSAPSMTCHGQDNGLVLFTQAELIQLEAALHTISITRYRVTETENQRDGSTMHGVFAETQTGFLFIQQLAGGGCL